MTVSVHSLQTDSRPKTHHLATVKGVAQTKVDNLDLPLSVNLLTGGEGGRGELSRLQDPIVKDLIQPTSCKSKFSGLRSRCTTFIECK